MGSTPAGPKTGAAPRPLSPHLQVWRWTPTMAASIVHRATGVGLYAGTFALALFVFAAATSAPLYAAIAGFLGSPIGLVLMFGYAFALIFHTLNGLRHLYWDMGRGLDLRSATLTAWLAFAAAAIAAVVILGAALSARGA